VEYLLYAVVALVVASYLHMAWVGWRGDEPEFGWLFFWHTTAVPFGIFGLGCALALTKGWFEEIFLLPISSSLLGMVCAVGVVVTGSHMVLVNLEQWQGIPTQGLRNDIRHAQRTALIFALSFAAYLIGQRIGQFLYDAVLHGSRAPQGLDASTIARTLLVIGGCSAIPVIGTWALALRLWTLTPTTESASSIGLVSGVVEAASRARVILVGLLFFIFAAMVLAVSVPALIAALRGQGEWIFSTLGTAFGAYLILVHGVGPIFTALSRSRISDDTHGQARWATLAELRAAGLAPLKNGLYLGSFLVDGAPRETVGYPGTIHLITIGPNNSGKGTGLIIPNLAMRPQSIFIIDPKGEAAAVTARHRAKFGPVRIINPFNVLVKDLPHLASTGFNPLADLDVDDDNFTDDCVGIAKALVRDQFDGDGAFFTGSAQDLITALIMHEKLTRGDAASLANVRRMLTEPHAEDQDGNPAGLAKTIDAMANSQYGALRSKAGRFKVPSRSNSDIISTAANETQLLDSPALQRDLEMGAIDWELMRREITTVYLILPADRLQSHANYLRLVVTSALRSLLRNRPTGTLPPVLFMLDEFAQLGYLPPVENAMGIARGYGVQLWPFLQDLNQLKALYKDRWQTFIGPRGVLTAFAPQDMFTADYLSQLCGTKTVIVQTENSRADSGAPGTGRGPQGQPLIRPEELMGLPAGQMLCFVNPVKYPFLTHAAGYWTMSIDEQLDRNPYYRG